jgi:hypothetical protein
LAAEGKEMSVDELRIKSAERLSARDMDKVVKAIWPDGGYRSERYDLSVKLLNIATKYGDRE